MSKSDAFTTRDETVICRGCEESFTVPVVFLGKDRPVGSQPELCPGCVEKAELRKAQIINAEEQARQSAEDAERQREVLNMVELAGGNPYEYSRYTLDNFEPFEGREKALQATRDWVASILSTTDKYAKIRGLYLTGPTGTAKTLLSHCALRALVDAGLRPGKDVIFDDSLSLIERIQDTYSSGDSTWALLAQRFNARIWIFDDLGAEKPSDDVVRKLTVIFNRRVGRPSMVTSNDEPKDITTRNGGFYRLRSRFGTADFRTVKAWGDDGRFLRVAENGKPTLALSAGS